MAKKKKVTYQIWIDARKRFGLSHVHIQMAKELGMNPKKFGQLANHKQETWKAPLPIFIEKCYFKRFKKERPTEIKTIEQLIEKHKKKKAKQKVRKQHIQAHEKQALIIPIQH